MPLRISLILVCSLVLVAPLLASNYAVNDLGDATDQTPGDDTCATAGAVCTLRAAIEEANAHAGADSITFSVAGTITPPTALPIVTQQTTIDATGAPGYAGAPVVVLASGGVQLFGLELADTADASQVLGLKIHGFSGSIARSSAAMRRTGFNSWAPLNFPRRSVRRARG